MAGSSPPSARQGGSTINTEHTGAQTRRHIRTGGQHSGSTHAHARREMRRHSTCIKRMYALPSTAPNPQKRPVRNRHHEGLAPDMVSIERACSLIGLDKYTSNLPVSVMNSRASSRSVMLGGMSSSCFECRRRIYGPGRCSIAPAMRSRFTSPICSPHWPSLAKFTTAPGQRSTMLSSNHGSAALDDRNQRGPPSHSLCRSMPISEKFSRNSTSRGKKNP